MRTVFAALAATLTRDRDQALLFRDLATLRTDIPLFDNVDELRWNGPTPAFQPLAARLDAEAATLALEFPEGDVVAGTLELGEPVEAVFFGRPAAGRW